MTCLSLWQPWASLLVHGKKRVETGGWDMKHRGPLLIHATLRWKAGDWEKWSDSPPFRSALEAIGNSFDPDAWYWRGHSERKRKSDLEFAEHCRQCDRSAALAALAAAGIEIEPGDAREVG